MAFGLDFKISAKRLKGWLVTLAAISKLLRDLTGNNRSKDNFECTCVPVEQVILRHKPFYDGKCRGSPVNPV